MVIDSGTLPFDGTSVVALGGGHGLHASLSALRRVASDLTAVVTVADNGGSSGRLRQQFDVLPPGDLRMALAALCSENIWGATWADVLQHRFAGEGEMNGHVVGNLLIVGLWERLGDPVQALDMVGRLLGARGRVLPMSTTPIDILAAVEGADPEHPDEISTVRGQVQVATTPGQILSVALLPDAVPACPQATAAIADADWIIIGPGSWFTSVIPHLLVPELRDALVKKSHRLIVILNLNDQSHETHGFVSEDYLSVLSEVAPELQVHTVIADPGSVKDAVSLRQAVAEMGGRLMLAEVAKPDTAEHDHDRLAVALAQVFASEQS